MVGNNRKLLHIVFKQYGLFLFLDAVESLLYSRKLYYIHTFLTSLCKALSIGEGDIVTDKLLESEENKLKETGKGYWSLCRKQIVNNNKFCNVDVENYIKSITAKLVVNVFNDNDLVDAIQNFIVDYDKIIKLHKGFYIAPLVEFHNAMAHLITAVVAYSKYKDDDQEKGQKIMVRNIDKAKSHLNRGG